MKSSCSTLGHVAIVLGAIVVASLLSAPFSSASAAEPGAPTSPQTAPAPTPEPTQVQRDAWRAAIAKVPMPKEGCFTAVYPKTEWQEVPCATAPPHPYPPARPDTVGNGTDNSAEVTSGFISSATGSFDSVSATSETETYTTPTGPVTVNNTFSLQLNTNNFKTPACNPAKNPSVCLGWQQFVYSNSGVAFVQYWLLNYETTCPTGWNAYGIDCWRNASNAVGVPVRTIANLHLVKLIGEANSTTDTVSMDIGSGPLYLANNPDSVLTLTEGWKAAEFNVFGDCCGTEANFNNGSTIIVRTSVDNKTANAPICLPVGYTGETNNLTLLSPCCPISGTSPAIVFTQSSATGTKSMCACPARSKWDPSSATCACQIKGEVVIAGQCACPPNTFFHAGQCECDKTTANGKCS
jgi:hypothetical protein